MPHPDVLLIEASDAARYALRLELQSLGAAVRQAQSVEQALPALRARRPDLIISAPTLPGMNALDLLELLRGSDGGKAPPVIIHSPAADWPLAGPAIARGALAVVDTQALRSGLPGWLGDAAALSPAALSPAAESPPAACDAPSSANTSGVSTAAASVIPAARSFLLRLAPAWLQRAALSAAHCRALLLVGTLLGLVIGLGVAALLQG